jgi:hypothetical protein
MIAGLGEEEAVVFYSIDQAMFLGDAPGPDAGAEMAQRFGFADAVEGITADGFNEFEYSKSNFPIRGDPVRQIF